MSSPSRSSDHLHPGMLSKVGFEFLDYRSPELKFGGQWDEDPDEECVISRTLNCQIAWSGVASEVVALFVKHDWSGKIAYYRDQKIADVFDLYSWFKHIGMIRLVRAQEDMPLKIQLLVHGASEQSRGREMVFKGLLVRRPNSKAVTSSARENETRIKSDVLEKAATLSPAEYAKLQTAQIDRWHEDLIKRGIDPKEYGKLRVNAYEKRIAEALVYTTPGDTYLDIGGGSLQDQLIKRVKDAGVDYYYLDIDDRSTAHNRQVIGRFGYPPERIMRGENSKIPFSDGFFDVVFSSHCLEHSRVPEETFSEIKRALKPGGHLFFAVPVGWDAGPEHMYCLDEAGWVEFTRDMGFQVRNVHVGNVYTEIGYDLAIVAQK